MKIGSKGKNPKQKTTTIQEPSQQATNSTIAAISKEEEGEKSKNNHKEQDKYKESDDLQIENSDKSSDTTILADVHVSE